MPRGYYDRSKAKRKKKIATKKVATKKAAKKKVVKKKAVNGRRKKKVTATKKITKRMGRPPKAVNVVEPQINVPNEHEPFMSIHRIDFLCHYLTDLSALKSANMGEATTIQLLNSEIVDTIRIMRKARQQEFSDLELAVKKSLKKVVDEERQQKMEKRVENLPLPFNPPASPSGP